MNIDPYHFSVTLNIFILCLSVSLLFLHLIMPLIEGEYQKLTFPSVHLLHFRVKFCTHLFNSWTVRSRGGIGLHRIFEYCQQLSFWCKVIQNILGNLWAILIINLPSSICLSVTHLGYVLPNMWSKVSQLWFCSLMHISWKSFCPYWFNIHFNLKNRCPG